MHQKPIADKPETATETPAEPATTTPSPFAAMPTPPYYAVIFANQASDKPEGYTEMATEMRKTAATMPGYIGLESARDEKGFAVTVSYWESEAAIASWRNHARHRLARKTGRDRWYKHFILRVAKVERHYDGP